MLINERRQHPATILTVGILVLALVGFFSQAALAGPGCGAAKGKTTADKTGCPVKACAAKATCVKTAEVTATSAVEAVKWTKEECVAKCMAQGMTKEDAETYWAKHCAGEEKKACSKEECIAKCMAQGMTKEEAEACWAKHASGESIKSCTKEQCIAKLMAGGMTEEEAEVKYAACKAEGKCTGKHSEGQKACCAIKTTEKSAQ